MPYAALHLEPWVVVAQEPQEHSEQVMKLVGFEMEKDPVQLVAAQFSQQVMELVGFEMEKDPVQLVAAQLPEMDLEQGRGPVLGTDLLEGMVSEPISALELGRLELVGISKKP